MVDTERKEVRREGAFVKFNRGYIHVNLYEMLAVTDSGSQWAVFE